MFKNSFSFDGRIRRTEYGISFIIYVFAAAIINAIIGASGKDAAIIGIAYIPLLWFLWAQGAKRCHDLGNDGWMQIVPFYVFWMTFKDGQAGLNKYGDNPKGIQSQNLNPQEGYQGGYTGGHNHQTSSYSSTENHSKNSGYHNGDLYN